MKKMKNKKIEINEQSYTLKYLEECLQPCMKCKSKAVFTSTNGTGIVDTERIEIQGYNVICSHPDCFLHKCGTHNVFVSMEAAFDDWQRTFAVFELTKFRG